MIISEAFICIFWDYALLHGALHIRSAEHVGVNRSRSDRLVPVKRPHNVALRQTGSFSWIQHSSSENMPPSAWTDVPASSQQERTELT